MNGGAGERLEVDHATWAGPALEALRTAFDATGLRSDYGGPHANGVTHMAVVGFPDGSYLELIAPREPGTASPIWEAAMRTDAGPAAWAVRTDRIDREVERLRSAGVPVRGPEPWTRETPEGRTAAWELAFPGEGEPGSVLPFLIEDRTPRRWRTRPTRGIERTGVAGLGQVVLVVRDAAAADATLRRAYGWGAPVEVGAPAFGARVSRFEGTPACVAEPLRSPPPADLSPTRGAALRAPGVPGESVRRLQARLEAIGPAPAAFLLRLDDRDAADRALPLGAEEPWPGGTVRWLESEGLGTRRLGVLWT
ncbi:MAG: VOC family protein [Candidatus Palauibacterales bacterium]|nr:VOC family protein [Candidatus Palauibacterales bacterium]MDP2530721.1 VOC family protein [Candidatus Palauibacterales bacterium]